MAIQQYIWPILSYFFGSINFAIVVNKIFMPRQDIRKFGSGNVGATNITRMMGLKYGAIVWILDGAKAALPAYFAKQLGDSALMITAYSAMLGHIFPVFAGFKGGKGFAVFSISSIVFGWEFFILLITTFALIKLTLKHTFLASIISSIALLMLSYIVFPNYLNYFIVSSITIIAAHYKNLKDLINNKKIKRNNAHE